MPAYRPGHGSSPAILRANHEAERPDLTFIYDLKRPGIFSAGSENICERQAASPDGPCSQEGHGIVADFGFLALAVTAGAA